MSPWNDRRGSSAADVSPPCVVVVSCMVEGSTAKAASGQARACAARPASQPVAGPQEAGFDRRQGVVPEAALPVRLAGRRGREAEPAAHPAVRGGHRLQAHVLAVLPAHHRTQVADAVDQPELERLLAGPETAAEKRVLVAL